MDPSVVLQSGARWGLLSITGGDLSALVVAVRDLCSAVERNALESEQQDCLEKCLAAMLDLTAGSMRGAHGIHPAVIAARNYLRQRFHETVTLEELGHISRMSRFHLVRAFAAHIGLTPHAYQTRLRVERAMALLRKGLRPGEVATLTGFADQSHLTRHFRRIVGVTPGNYVLGA
jgi:AraC-like DNA-binding protein